MNQPAMKAEPDDPRFYFAKGARGGTIYHNPGPNRLRFPVLFVADDCGDQEEIGRRVAELLSKHWEGTG